MPTHDEARLPLAAIEAIEQAPGNEARKGDRQREPAVVLGRPRRPGGDAGDDRFTQPVPSQRPPREIDGQQEPEAEGRIGERGAAVRE